MACVPLRVNPYRHVISRIYTTRGYTTLKSIGNCIPCLLIAYGIWCWLITRRIWIVRYTVGFPIEKRITARLSCNGIR